MTQPLASHPTVERAREARRQSLLQRMTARECLGAARDQRVLGVPVAAIHRAADGTVSYARRNLAFAALVEDGDRHRLADAVLRAVAGHDEARADTVADAAPQPLCIVRVRPGEFLVSVAADAGRVPLGSRVAHARIDTALRAGSHVVTGLVHRPPVPGPLVTAPDLSPVALRKAQAALRLGDQLGRLDGRGTFVATVDRDRRAAGRRFDRLVEHLVAGADRPVTVSCAEARPGEDAQRLLTRLQAQAGRRRSGV